MTEDWGNGRRPGSGRLRRGERGRAGDAPPREGGFGNGDCQNWDNLSRSRPSAARYEFLMRVTHAASGQDRTWRASPLFGRLPWRELRRGTHYGEYGDLCVLGFWRDVVSDWALVGTVRVDDMLSGQGHVGLGSLGSYWNGKPRSRDCAM